MTLAICSYVLNHAAVPLAAMLIKLMYEAVLMANIPIAFVICNHIFYYWTNKTVEIINLHTSCIGPCNISTFDIFC